MISLHWSRLVENLGHDNLEYSLEGVLVDLRVGVMALVWGFECVVWCLPYTLGSLVIRLK